MLAVTGRGLREHRKTQTRKKTQNKQNIYFPNATNGNKFLCIPLLDQRHIVPQHWVKQEKSDEVVRGTTDWNLLPWSGLTHSGGIGPGKEWETKKLPTTGRIGKGQKEGRDSSAYVLPTSQNPPHWNPSWLSDASTPRKDPELEWLDRDNPKTKTNTQKSVTFLYINDQVSEGEIKETIPFTIASKRTKYPGIKYLGRQKTCTSKTKRHWCKKLKTSQTDGKIHCMYCVLGLE